MTMDEQLIAHALALILDDIRVGEWATGEVDKRLGRKGPQDHEFWKTYTQVTNELLEASPRRTERLIGESISMSLLLFLIIVIGVFGGMMLYRFRVALGVTLPVIFAALFGLYSLGKSRSLNKDRINVPAFGDVFICEPSSHRTRRG
jgi:hypothetical protein